MQLFFSGPNNCKGINFRVEECPGLHRPRVSERLTYAREIAINNRPDALLVGRYLVFQALPLACKALQSVCLRRSQVDFIETFRVDERHLSQGECINTITLDWPPEISS
jgi:hypothetical protein